MSDWMNVTRLWQADDDAARVQVVERFLAASSRGDYEKLYADYQLMFGKYSSLVTVDDVRSVCELLRTASMMFALCHSEGSSDFEDYHGCGLSPVFLGWGDPEKPSKEISPNSFCINFMFAVRGAAYTKWMIDAAETMKNRSLFPNETMRFKDGYLSYSSDLKDIEKYPNAHKDCASIFEQLMNLHLVDVATVCDGFSANRANYKQVAYSGISLLWLGLSEMLSGGRAFRCEACGKPTVAYAERRKRKFCCPACRKWANAHPGEKRMSWYIEKR